MSTPGRRRALRALAERKQSNKQRIKHGQKPILNNPQTGKPQAVSLGTFRKRTGASIRRIKNSK